MSVLLNESVEALNIEARPNGIYLDGTLGGAGHSKVILSKLGEKGLLLGIDRDKEVFSNASKILNDYYGKFILVHGNFCDINEIADSQGIDALDGAILDLGVSSYQLDNPERGFSYMHDAALDMRMDAESTLTAYDIVNGCSEQELNSIIFNYGEERWAKRIAEFIVKERAEKPIKTTFELVSVIKKAVPKAAREDGPHPAKRTFMAIRIQVNQELKILEKAISDIVSRLSAGGRIAVITFHSLEDRIIKNAFKTHENPCDCPRELPVCVCGKKPQLRIITRKPILPSQAELDNNHRASSAKLRVAEKILPK